MTFHVAPVFPMYVDNKSGAAVSFSPCICHILDMLSGARIFIFTRDYIGVVHI